MPQPFHSLLRRQMKRHLRGGVVLPRGWEAFLESVDQAYRQADDDRQMVERSLDLSSRELHEANHSMRHAKEAAEQAALAKGEFLANMSHEIRTPMNAVIGLTVLLLDTGLTGEQREYLETVRAAGSSLLRIIDDILDFSRIECKGLQLENCPVTVRDCVDSSVELFGQRAASLGLELVCRVAPGVPSAILGDSTRIRQILVNLIGNAVKFTAEGEITVSVSSQPAGEGWCELEFAVADTGIGIPAAKMNRLFQSFSQVDCSTTRKYGGTGLGLAISHRLAGLMGGRLWAESEFGRGSAFRFTLPAAVQQAAPAGNTLPGRSALIADGHAGASAALAGLLQALGLAVTTVDSADAAAGLLKGRRFDLVAVDGKLAAAPELAQAVPGPAGTVLLVLTKPGQAGPLPAAWVGAIQVAKPVRELVLRQLLERKWSTGDAPAGSGVEPGGVRAREMDETLGERLPLNILLAEDNAVNQRVLLKLLERFGYHADLAQTGHEVLAAVSRKRYDLVMMDMHMPEMDGLEATRILRERNGTPPGVGPRIVALTASALPQDRARCLEVGMDEYVTKPIHIQDLRRLLETCAAASVRESATLSS